MARGAEGLVGKMQSRLDELNSRFDKELAATQSSASADALAELEKKLDQELEKVNSSYVHLNEFSVSNGERFTARLPCSVKPVPRG